MIMAEEISQLKFGTYEAEIVNPLAGHAMTDMESYVASLLLGTTAERPIGISEIITHVGLALERRADKRSVKMTIRSLRKDHAFPILSRKQRPSGYWWCGSAEEMRGYIDRWQTQPLDELHTLSVIVRQNYPELAGQLRLPESVIESEGDYE